MLDDGRRARMLLEGSGVGEAKGNASEPYGFGHGLFGGERHCALLIPIVAV